MNTFLLGCGCGSLVDIYIYVSPKCKCIQASDVIQPYDSHDPSVRAIGDRACLDIYLCNKLYDLLTALAARLNGSLDHQSKNKDFRLYDKHM